MNSSVVSRLVLLLALAGIAWVATGCDGDGGSGSSNLPVNPPPTASPPTTPPPSNPSRPTFGAPSLAPTLESGGATSGTFGPTGGTLAATAADGTRFELAIPPSALGADTDITLTPVSAIGNLPLDGGLLAAVELQPAGLEFRLPATLTIQRPAAAPALHTGFGWSGAESRFGIAPVTLSADGRLASFLVVHFSGYGLGIPGPSQLDELAGELIAYGLEVDAAIEGILGLGDNPSAADFASYLEDWFDLIVKPRLDDGSGADVVAGLVAHQAMNNWTQFWALVGSPAELAGRNDAGRAQDLANLTMHHSAYTRPLCSGTVANWQDWLRVPDELHLRVKVRYPEAVDQVPALQPGPSYDEGSPGHACAEVVLDFVDVPAALGAQQTEVAMKVRARLVHPGGALPLATEVQLAYDAAATGEAEVLTAEDDGLAAFTVERDPTWASFTVEAEAVEPSLGRPEVLNASAFRIVGETGLRFFEVSTGAQPILAPGAERTLTLFFSPNGVPVLNQAIQLSLEGPGSLAAVTVQTTDVFGDVAVAEAKYVGPAGPVIKNYVATLTATTTYNGVTYQAKFVLHPYWIDLALKVNNGSALVEATNGSVPVMGDGPFAIHAVVTGAGATTADPPLPIDLLNDSLAFETTDPVEETLRFEAGACCATSLGIGPDATGTAIVEWMPDNAIEQENHLLTVSYLNNGAIVERSVTLQRQAAQSVSVQVATSPLKLSPGVPGTLTIWGLGAAPAGAWVELSVTGGTPGAVGGLVDVSSGRFETTLTSLPGHSCVWVEARLYTASGGTLLGTGYANVEVQALAGASLSVGGTLYVSFSDGTNGTFDSATPGVSSNRCSAQSPAGPTQTAEGEASVSYTYAGTNASCQGVVGSGSASRSLRIDKNADLSQLSGRIEGKSVGDLLTNGSCFEVARVINMHGALLELAEPAHVTFSATATHAGGNGSTCGTSTVYFAQVNPVGGWGLGAGVERYACVYANAVSGGDSAACPNGTSGVFPTGFAGVLPAGRYQVYAEARPYFKPCTLTFSADIAVGPP